jgi:hypothetical protein
MATGDIQSKEVISNAGNTLGDDDSETQLLSHDPLRLQDIIANDQCFENYIEEMIQESEKASAPGNGTQQPYDIDANQIHASDTDGKQPSKEKILLVYPFVDGKL